MEREYDPGAHEDQTPWKKKNKNKMKNKRRFSDEQIGLLESIFESETRLEPRKKLAVARDLGLQPRQVAIWFQNRRARWKSKQMEKDFRTLRANYDSLASRFESLKNEKQCLILQMQKLSELLAEPHDISKGSKGGFDGICTGGGGSEHGGDTKCEPEAEAQPSFQSAGLEDGGFHSLQIEKYGNIIEHAGQQQQRPQPGEEEFLSMDHEYRNEFPASPEKLYGFDSAYMFDHSFGKNQENSSKLKQKARKPLKVTADNWLAF